MLNIIKPPGVIDIDFKLDEVSVNDSNYYYMDISYIVPDKSEYLNGFKDSTRIRMDWNNEIRKTISDYFGVRVMINATGIVSEPYYKIMKGR